MINTFINGKKMACPTSEDCQGVCGGNDQHNPFGKETGMLVVKKWVQEAGLTVPEQKSVAIYPESLFRPKNCKPVFCHMELLHSSTSTTVHLTQLAATNTTNFANIFLPILPSLLPDLLDRYRVGNLIEVMKVLKEDRQTFLFREHALVSETKRLECVQELAGPNVVLVGVDEDSIGVLLQKLKSQDAKKFLQLVVGYTW